MFSYTFSRFGNKHYHSSPDNGSGAGCGNIDCEYRDRCDKTGENCLRQGHGPEACRYFGDPDLRFTEEPDGGRPCRICEYFYECDHSGKNCRRGPSEGRRGSGHHSHKEVFGFDGRRHHGRRESPGFEADSLRSLLIRAAQSMHHPQAGASQELVLRILDREGSPDQQFLLRELRVRPGSLSELLGKLEQKGLIERERSESDRRRVIVRLTESGRKALTPGETAADDPFAVLTDEEQSSLRALLNKVLGLSDSDDTE